MTRRRCDQCGRSLNPTESVIETTEEVTMVAEDGTEAIESRKVTICRSCSALDVD